MRKLMCSTDQPNQAGWAHNGPDMLTWHRALLLDFERALNAVSERPVAVPYWDWTNPASTRAMLSRGLMGTGGRKANGYVVTNGPFRRGNWRIHVKGPTVSNPAQSDWIVRGVGNSAAGATAPSARQVRTALSRSRYDVAPFGITSDMTKSFVSYVNGSVGDAKLKCKKGVSTVVGATGSILHGQGHMYIGGEDANGDPGTLSDTVASPNDPIFWLHHANIDRLAERWWIRHDHQYLPLAGGPRGTNLGDVLWPYDVTNGDMAKPSATFGYTYDLKPPARRAAASGRDFARFAALLCELSGPAPAS